MEKKSSSLKIKTKDDIQYITLNRPEKRNALNPEMIQELLSVFQKQKWPPSTRAILLSGEGKVFCSGADLKWMADESLFTKEELENLFSLFSTIALCALPVITLAKGFAVGGGLGLLAVSDIVIAEEKTQFLFSETKLGLVPSIISPFILKKVGLSQAKFLMLSALTFSAKQAKEIGLIHFTGSKKNCDDFLKKLLKQFKELDIKAVSETKKWLNSLSPLPFFETNYTYQKKKDLLGKEFTGKKLSGKKFLDKKLLDKEYPVLNSEGWISLKKESARIISSARNSESAKKRIKNLLKKY